jgi:hypothetical protein
MTTDELQRTWQLTLISLTLQSTNMRTLSRLVSALLHMVPVTELVEPGEICTSTGSVDHLIVQTMSLHQLPWYYASALSCSRGVINLGQPSGAW